MLKHWLIRKWTCRELLIIHPCSWTNPGVGSRAKFLQSSSTPCCIFRKLLKPCIERKTLSVTRPNKKKEQLSCSTLTNFHQPLCQFHKSRSSFTSCEKDKMSLTFSVGVWIVKMIFLTDPYDGNKFSVVKAMSIFPQGYRSKENANNIGTKVW